MSAFVACCIEQFGRAERCEVAKVIQINNPLHEYISKTAPRKLILCALGMSDQAKAREVFSQMSAPNQKDPSTMYLLYKVALRSRDSELG